MFGGSFIKSIITGTVAKTTTPETRAKGYSIFYGIVNVGAFLGKTFAYPIRIELGLTAINYFSAIMSFVALIVVVFFYKNVSADGEGKTVKEVWDGFVRVVTNMRLLTLIFIVTGFWIIQHQLYATMPKYVLRTVGEHASPEWIANVNPAVVMALVMFITHLMRNVKAVSSMAVGMFLMPVSALLMASSNLLGICYRSICFNIWIVQRSSNYSYDDLWNNGSRFSGMFYFSALLRIFFITSSKR